MKSGIGFRHTGSGFVLTTNLIVHHGIADVFDQATQLICILDVVEKSLDLALLRQWLEFLLNLFEFPKGACLSNDSRPRRFLAHCSKFRLLSPSFKSPSETDVQSEIQRALTLGASDSIACLFALVRWNARKRCG